MPTDSHGNAYVEFPMSDQEFIRPTLVKDAAWAGAATIRIQKRRGNGRLAQGPEFPSSKAGELARSLIELLQAS